MNATRAGLWFDEVASYTIHNGPSSQPDTDDGPPIVTISPECPASLQKH